MCYLKPQKPPSAEPLIDEYTRKATAAFRASKPDAAFYLGFHVCTCEKAQSAACDFILPDGTLTNSLLIHYLAMHREEVDWRTLSTIGALDIAGADPTQEEIFPSVRTFDYMHKKQ